MSLHQDRPNPTHWAHAMRTRVMNGPDSPTVSQSWCQPSCKTVRNAIVSGVTQYTHKKIKNKKIITTTETEFLRYFRRRHIEIKSQRNISDFFSKLAHKFSKILQTLPLAPNKQRSLSLYGNICFHFSPLFHVWWMRQKKKKKIRKLKFQSIQKNHLQVTGKQILYIGNENTEYSSICMYSLPSVDSLIYIYIYEKYQYAAYKNKQVPREKEEERVGTRSTDSFLISSRLIGLSPPMVEAGDDEDDERALKL